MNAFVEDLPNQTTERWVMAPIACMLKRGFLQTIGR
jgi:hypothetical protein